MNNNQFGRHVPVPSFGGVSKNDNAIPPHGSEEATPTNQDTVVTLAPPPSVSIPPEPQHSSLLPDLSAYDLTVGEALDVFSLEHRKRPSGRTMQRYCQDGRFDCYKLKTTRNGNPVAEWIINSSSLRNFVSTKPEETNVSPLPTPATSGDAADVAPKTNSVSNPSSAIATPTTPDDATGELDLARTPDIRPDVIASPVADDDANIETRSRVQLMIENAELTARLETKEELVGELREDKSFLKEQVTHQRKNDTLMADMHRETLQALKAVAVAGRHTKIELPTANGEVQDDSFYDVSKSVADAHDPETDGV